MQTDASDTLEFASRTLNAAERNYSVPERECLAVVWAIHKCHSNVEGYNFKVITDHSSLRWLHNLHNPTGRLARWALELQGHRLEIEHWKGALNHVPDALSRVQEEIEPGVCFLTWAESTKDKKYQSWL